MPAKVTATLFALFLSVLAVGVAAASSVDHPRDVQTFHSPDGTTSITFDSLETYSDCPSVVTSDTITVTGIPQDWRIYGEVELSYVLNDTTRKPVEDIKPGGIYTVEFKSLQDGDVFSLTVEYPPYEVWPPRDDQLHTPMSEIHVDIALNVHDAANESVSWVGADQTNSQGVLGPSQDWSFYCRLSVGIGDLVWEDLNGNGIQDDGSSGLDGVEVALFDMSDTLVMTQTTRAGPDGVPGYYLFTKQKPGDYYVVVVPPAGYEFSPSLRSADSTMDSDADPATGRFDLPGARVQELTHDVGLFRRAQVAGLVWQDHDRDGVQTGAGAEPGMAGVTVHLYQPGTDQPCDADATPLASTPTTDDGSYRFSALVPGDYCLGYVAPDGLEFTPREAGDDRTRDSDVDPTTGLTPVFSLQSGEQDARLDAGLFDPPFVFLPLLTR